MSKVNFMDTSVMLELLNIPGKSSHHDEINKEYLMLSYQEDAFVLPLATLIETGNHIAHVSDGNLRRIIASKFSELIKMGIHAENGWNIDPEVPLTILESIIQKFPDQAMTGVGLGDMSIIAQFENYWNNKQPIGIMRLWSMDTHLQGYIREGGLKRRKSN